MKAVGQFEKSINVFGSVAQWVQRLSYRLNAPGTESRWGEFSRPSRPALGPTQPPVQWVQNLSRGKVQTGRVADLSPPSSAAVIEE